jgi:hypothetical protein
MDAGWEGDVGGMERGSLALIEERYHLFVVAKESKPLGVATRVWLRTWSRRRGTRAYPCAPPTLASLLSTSSLFGFHKTRS